MPRQSSAENVSHSPECTYRVRVRDGWALW